MLELNTPETAQEMLLCKNIGDFLEKKYPGCGWLITADQGIVTIRSMLLSGSWGYVLHEDKIDSDYKVIMRAAGEILERFGMPRGRFNPDRHANLIRRHGLPVFEK